MSIGGDLDSIFESWEDFSYEKVLTVDQVDDIDTVLDKVQELRSYSGSFKDRSFAFSLEKGELEGETGYGFSSDSEDEAFEYFEEMMSRLSGVRKVGEEDYFLSRKTL